MQTLGEPNHRFANRGMVPGHFAKQPRRTCPSEMFGSCFVEDDLRVAMLLQKTGRDDRRDIFFDRLFDDRGFAFAESKQENLLRFEDRADTHRDGTARDIVFAKEIACRIASRQAIERNHAGAAAAARTGFVETDVPRATYAQDLYVDATHAVDFFFVLPAAFVDIFFGQRAVGNVDVAFGNVEVIEQMLVHKSNIALQLLGRHRVVFVEIEGDDVLEREAVLLVHPYEFIVDFGRRTARGQAKDTRLAGIGPLTNQLGNLLGDVDASIACVRKNLAGDPFQLVGPFRGKINVGIFRFHRHELALLWGEDRNRPLYLYGGGW